MDKVRALLFPLHMTSFPCVMRLQWNLNMEPRKFWLLVPLVKPVWVSLKVKRAPKSTSDCWTDHVRMSVLLENWKCYDEGYFLHYLDKLDVDAASVVVDMSKRKDLRVLLTPYLENICLNASP